MLQNEESVCRAALLPRMVLSGVISPAKVIADLQKVTREDGTVYYALSLGSDSLLPSWDQKHDYGCRVAAKTNIAASEKASAAGANFQRTFYRGAYLMSVGSIHGASTQLFNLEVHLRPLEGLDEHCDLEMTRTNQEATKAEVSTDRTRIIARLRLLLQSPHHHLCDCDVEFRESIESINLTLT